MQFPGILSNVTPGLTTWLITALLALATAQCAPATITTSTCALNQTISLAKAQRKNQSATKYVAQRRDSHAFDQPQTLPDLVNAKFPKSLSSTNPTLFQRPPPSSFLNRVSNL